MHSFGWGDEFSICALRPTGVYGVNSPIKASKWYDLIQRVVAGETVECRRGGKEVNALDVARAAVLLLDAEQVSGEYFNCYDRYVSEFEVAQIANELAGGKADVVGQAKQPKHQIETGKLRSLGMEFGGDALLRETIAAIVAAVRS